MTISANSNVAANAEILVTEFDPETKYNCVFFRGLSTPSDCNNGG